MTIEKTFTNYNDTVKLKKELEAITQTAVVPRLVRTIQPDCSQEYNLTEDFFQPNVMLLDGLNKIAEIVCDKDSMSIISYTDKPIKIANSLKAKHVHIKASGTINFEKPVQCNYATIDTKGASFKEAVQVTQGITVKAQSDVVFNKTLQTGFLNLNSTTVNFKGDVRCSEELKVTANKINIEESFLVKESTELKAHEVTVLKNIKTKELNIDAKNLIKTKAAITVTNNVTLNAPQIQNFGRIITKKGYLNVPNNEMLYCSDDSLLQTPFFNCKSNHVALNGESTFKAGCQVAAKRLDISSIANWQGSALVDCKEWNLFEGAQLTLNHTNKEYASSLMTEDCLSIQTGAKLDIHCAPASPEIALAVSAGRVEVQGEMALSHLNLQAKEIFINENAKLSAQTAILDVEEILNDGDLSQIATVINAKTISQTKKSSSLYQNCELVSGSFSSIGSCEFIQASAETKDMNIEGLLTANKFQAKSKNVVIKAKEVSGQEVLIESDHVEIGSNSKNKSITLKQYVLKTKSLETRGNVILKNTSVEATGNKVSKNYGTLVLDNSAIVSDGQFVNDKKGKITIEGESEKVKDMPSLICAKNIYNAGSLTLSHSKLITNTLNHVGNTLTANQSAVCVKEDLLIDDQAKLILNNKSVLAGGDTKVLVSEGSIVLDNESYLEASALTALPTALQQYKKATAKIKNKLSNQGHLELDKGSLSANTDVLLGTLNADNSAIHATSTDIMGEAHISNSQLNVSDNLIVRPSGKVMLASSKIRAESMDHQGYLKSTAAAPTEVAKGDSEKTTAVATARPKQPNKMPATLSFDNFKTHYGSVIEGDQLTIAVGTWQHEGNIHLSNGLSATGKTFVSNGQIQADTSIDLGFNTFLNSGSIHTNRMKVKAGISANLGFIEANNFTNSSFISVNAGLQSVYNYQNNAFFTVNAGLQTPNLPEASHIFSMDNIKSISRSVVSSALPQWSSVINLSSAVPGMYSTLESAWQNRDAFTLNGILNTPIYEYVDHASNLKNFTVSASNLWTQGNDVLFKVQECYDSLNGKESSKAAEVAKNDKGVTTTPTPTQASKHLPLTTRDKIEKVATQAARIAATTLGPKYSSQSLYDSNYGDIYTHTYHESGYYSQNFGRKSALDSVTIDANQVNNSGNIQGLMGSVNLKGKKLVDGGMIGAKENVSINFENVKLQQQQQHTRANWQVNADSLTIEGKTKFLNGSMKLKTFDFDDEVEFNHTDLVCHSLKQAHNLDFTNESKLTVQGEHSIEKQATLSFSNYSQYVGNVLHSDGKTKFYESFGQANEVAFSSTAETRMKNGQLNTTSLADHGKFFYSGTAGLITESYDHTGHVNVIQEDGIDNQDNKFLVKAKKGTLNGSGDIAVGAFDIEKLDNGADFALGHGKYQKYQFNEALHIATNAKFDLKGQYDRSCTLNIKGTEINNEVLFKGNYDVSFEATKNDITLLNDLEVRNFVSKSKGNTYNYGKIHASNNIGITAEGRYNGFCNMGGEVVGEIVKIEAPKVKNITVNSELGKQYKKIGNSGIISARKKLFIDATESNIENHGGMLRGGEYCQLVAKEDILNICNETTRQGAHDVMKEWDAASIIGGAGTENKGVGVNIQAGGRFVNDGSRIVSNGDAYISGEKGVDFLARTHTYISNQYEEKKGLFGFKTERGLTVDNQVQNSQVIAGNGRIIVRSEQGEINADATHFISKNGSDLYSEKSIRLRSIITNHREYKFESSWWGLNKDERDHAFQQSNPTYIIDNGNSRLHSNKGDVELKGTEVLGEGDLFVKGQNAFFTKDKLENSTTIKKQSFTPSMFGMSAVKASQEEDRTVLKIMSAEDATLSKINALANSSSAASAAANTASLGLNAFNTANNFVGAAANNDIGGALMQRYGLGDTNGFNPTISFKLSQTETKSNSQTLGAGGIERQNITVIVEDKVQLDNGLVAHAKGDSKVVAKEMIVNAAELHSHTQSETNSVSVGVTATGEVANAGVGHAESESKEVRHVNAGFKTDGHMHLEVEKLHLRGGNVDSKTISGHVEKLEIESLQDYSYSSSSSFEANTSGAVSISKHEHESRKINQVSGMNISGGINNGSHTFKVGTANLKGGKIISNGSEVNDFAERVHAEAIHDYEKGSGFGVSFNVNDLNRLAGDAPATGDYKQSAIATAAVSFDKVDIEAIQEATIHGKEGTHLNKKKITGSLNTENAEGYNVTKHFEEHLTLDVPITNADYLQNAKQNFECKSADSITNKVIELPVTPTIEIANPEPETNNAVTTEKAPEAVLPEAENGLAISDPIVSQHDVPADNATQDFINQSAACAQMVMDGISVAASLSVAATGVGAVPAAGIAAYNLDQFLTNYDGCYKGDAHDSYLTKALKANFPTVERELRFINEAANALYYPSQLTHLYDDARLALPAIISGTKKALNKFSLFSDSATAQSSKPWTVHEMEPHQQLTIRPEDAFKAKSILIDRYDYSKPGDLPENLSATFAGKRYETYLLLDKCELPKAGSFPTPQGQFYSFETPVSEIQTRIDKAIKPVWPDGNKSTLDTVHIWSIPSGTKAHVGKIANQGSTFFGNTTQIVIEKPWENPAIKKVVSFPLKKD